MSPSKSQVLWPAVAGLACLLATSVSHADEAACSALSKAGHIPSTQLSEASWHPAQAGQNLPAYCEVTGVVSAVPKSRVGVVFRLPDGWNGKMVGFGGGGWAGNVVLATAVPALVHGYATAQTDGGHANPNGFEVDWARGNPVAMTDFAHRAVHVMTVSGKSVVAQYYGKAAKRNYFQGCSTGGRMGMMETQRYPADYDGVIAGAPVYSLLVQTTGLVRNRFFRAPGAAISAAQLKLVNDAAVAACDAADGLKDGVVTDPRACGWDPGALACPAATSGDQCLTPTQVAALRSAYSDIKNKQGVVGNYGLTRGGEGGWARFVQSTPQGQPDPMTGGLGALTVYLFGREDYDLNAFDPLKDQAAVHRTAFAKEYEATQADLAPYLKRGGKLLLWHGFDDPGPSPFATIDYYQRAKKANGADSAISLFLAPGVYHCRGGPGADDFDGLSALDRWVEQGVAPAMIPARNSQSGAERPMCAWPALPYYKGSGDPKKLASFECRGPAGS
jgi:feruloyl esterase